jgi:Spy/CpxP family protein refolding chaperone
MMAWWKWKQAAQHGACGASAGCGPHGAEHHHGGGEAFAAPDQFETDFGGGGFGVRRPLRFLAQRLDLDDAQVEALAQILNELKTERAQAAVDNRRAVAGFADVIAGEAFDEAKIGAAATERVKSAERLRDALVGALGKIHELLRKEQRAKLAYLIRTGALAL